ncbi:MAG: helix-turn-helix transcriptional regulator [Verrucomicrobia bacterium]|nr:helix-turn-helix transcriptional regulator [Verrucomicrobiota bacterium]
MHGNLRSAASADVAHALGERVKELNCLYGIARLAERHPGSLDRVLSGAVRILPPAWQHPRAARARIEYRGVRRQSPGFGQVVAVQSAPIRVGDGVAGEVAVGYVGRRPAADEGPFLREERALIEGVAEYLGAIAGRIETGVQLAEANRLLTVERESLREANIALRAVLSRIEEEKREMRRDVAAAVERVLMPILHALEVEMPASKRAYVDLLRRNLLDVAAPFASRLSVASPGLTPAETAVCTMIRSGLRTKEIARLRGIAAATVNRHREHIRRKLGLAGRRVNLVTHLQSLAEERPG